MLGRRGHLALSELDLERSPAAVGRLDDRVRLEACPVPVVEDLGVERPGVDPQVTHDEVLEQQPEPTQVAEQAVGGDTKRRHRQ